MLSEKAKNMLKTERPEDITDVIERAAQYLPDGYNVKINIERDGYEVELEDDHWKLTSVDGGDGIISDINEAICIAHGFTSE